MSLHRGLIFLALLQTTTAYAQNWCVPGEAPDLLNTYGPTSPVITNVMLNTIDRTTPTTDKELYVDTGLSTSLAVGQSYTLSVSYEQDLAFCPEYQLRVWIDWDQNDSFDDPGEDVLSENNFTPSSATVSVDVPANAVLGTTRMRVAMKMEVACGHDGILSCPLPEAFGWHGEIEDYTIEVVGAVACNAAPIVRLLGTKSNVTDVALNWTDDPAFASYSVYSVRSEDPTQIEFADGAGMLTHPVDITNVCKEVAQPCIDLGGVNAAPNLVYYQVVGVCANGDEGPISTPSLTELQTSIFTPSCAKSGCHSGPSPSAGLNLSLGATHASVVGVVSSEKPPLFRIAPGDPDQSYLIQKVVGDPTILGNRMPADGPPFLTPEQIAKLREWVSAGALP